MGTTATITGLFGAGTILGAGDSVATMQGWYRVGFGVLVALTLLAAACAIVCAFTASQPEIQPIPAELSKRVALHEQAFDRAVSNLTKSRWLAAAAVVLLIAAVAVLWYAPRTPTETQESSTAPGRSSLSQYRTAAPIDGVRPPLRTWLKAV